MPRMKRLKREPIRDSKLKLETPIIYARVHENVQRRGTRGPSRRGRIKREDSGDKAALAEDILKEIRQELNAGNYSSLTSVVLKCAMNKLNSGLHCNPHVDFCYDNTYDNVNSLKYMSQFVSGISVEIDGDSMNLSEDTCNMIFSHFPKCLGTSFRFQVGELAYVKWHGELCLVVINYSSQKLIACSDLEFEDDDETDGSDSSFAASSDGRDEMYAEPSRGPRFGRLMWLSDFNEEYFLDQDSHKMYSRANEFKPIKTSIPDYEDESAITRHYFMPIYYITFPGYKRKCSRTYRFWVKEKDLIKINCVKWPTRRSKYPDVNLSTNKTEAKADPVWCKRDVQSINEYVYKIRSNLYNRYIISGRCSGGQGYSGLAYLPWLIPKKLTEIVYAQYKRVSGVGNIANSFLPIENHFNTSSLLPRLSTRTLVQNFKYTVLVIAKLLRNTQDADFDVRNEESDQDGSEGGQEDDQNDEDSDDGKSPVSNPMMELTEDEEIPGELDEMFVPSLRFMEHLESALDGSLTYNYFFEAFVNNLYWVDVFVYWMDTNFTTKCCFTDTECRLIKHLGKNKEAPYSAFLGLEYFCRLFCFDTLYTSLLERMERRAGQCLTYLPITQLLIQYLTFVAADYAKTQEYGLDD